MKRADIALHLLAGATWLAGMSQLFWGSWTETAQWFVIAGLLLCQTSGFKSVRP